VLEHTFDIVCLVSSAPVSIREVGECFADLHRQLYLTLHESRMGAWELALTDLNGGRTIRRQYDDEPSARQAVELAYTYGRQFGRWKIQRAAGYEPDHRVPASPTGYEPEQSPP